MKVAIPAKNRQIPEKKDILIALSALQMLLDNYDSVKDSIIYSKKVKYLGNLLLNELEFVEDRLTRATDEKAVNQWVNIAQVTENVMREVIDVEPDKMDSLDIELQKLIEKYK